VERPHSSRNTHRPRTRRAGQADGSAPGPRSGRSPTSHARHFASASARSWYPLGQAAAGIPSKTSRRHSTLQKRMTWPAGRRGTRDASTAGVCHHYALASSARWRRARGGTVPPPELQHTRPEAPAGRACRGLPSNAPLTGALTCLSPTTSTSPNRDALTCYHTPGLDWRRRPWTVSTTCAMWYRGPLASTTYHSSRSGPGADRISMALDVSTLCRRSGARSGVYHQQTKNLLVSYSPKKLGFF
jgi:hypothetical protein